MERTWGAVNALLTAQVTNPGLQSLWASDPGVKEVMLRRPAIGDLAFLMIIKGLALGWRPMPRPGLPRIDPVRRRQPGPESRRPPPAPGGRIMSE